MGTEGRSATPHPAGDAPPSRNRRYRKRRHRIRLETACATIRRRCPQLPRLPPRQIRPNSTLHPLATNPKHPGNHKIPNRPTPRNKPRIPSSSRKQRRKQRPKQHRRGGTRMNQVPTPAVRMYRTTPGHSCKSCESCPILRRLTVSRYGYMLSYVHSEQGSAG